MLPPSTSSIRQLLAWLSSCWLHLYTFYPQRSDGDSLAALYIHLTSLDVEDGASFLRMSLKVSVLTLVDPVPLNPTVVIM